MRNFVVGMLAGVSAGALIATPFAANAVNESKPMPLNCARATADTARLAQIIRQNHPLRDNGLALVRRDGKICLVARLTR